MIVFMIFLLCVATALLGFTFGYRMEKRRQRMINAERFGYMQNYCEKDVELTQQMFERFQNAGYKPYRTPNEIRKDL